MSTHEEVEVSAPTHLSLKNILFPTDFSPASRAALPFALALARIYDSKLLVAHSIPAEPRRQAITDRLPAEEDPNWREAQKKLVEFTHDPQIGATRCEVLLNRGDVAEVILAMIREREADLVVVGTHGHRGVHKMLLGSQAEKIYRSASCPVLTVGPKAAAGEWKIRSILCPVDLAEDPEPALQYALSLADQSHAELVAVQAQPMVPWQHRASVERRSRQTFESLTPEAKDRLAPHFLVRWEDPVEAILNTAANRQADLIVMGVRKSRAAGWSTHLPWPVASEVVSRAACPVLTVRV